MSLSTVLKQILSSLFCYDRLLEQLMTHAHTHTHTHTHCSGVKILWVFLWPPYCGQGQKTIQSLTVLFVSVQVSAV